MINQNDIVDVYKYSITMHRALKNYYSCKTAKTNFVDSTDMIESLNYIHTMLNKMVEKRLRVTDTEDMMKYLIKFQKYSNAILAESCKLIPKRDAINDQINMMHSELGDKMDNLIQGTCCNQASGNSKPSYTNEDIRAIELKLKHLETLLHTTATLSVVALAVAIIFGLVVLTLVC